MSGENPHIHVAFIKTDYYQLNLKKKKNTEICKCVFVSSVSSEGVGFEIYEGVSSHFKGLIKAETFPQNIKIYGGRSHVISCLMGSRFH